MILKVIVNHLFLYIVQAKYDLCGIKVELIKVDAVVGVPINIRNIVVLLRGDDILRQRYAINTHKHMNGPVYVTIVSPGIKDKEYLIEEGFLSNIFSKNV